MSKGQDFFAKIAAENNTARAGLEKCPPLCYDFKPFAQSERLAPPAEQKDHRTLLAGHDVKMAALREHYDSFLRSRVTGPLRENRRIYLDEFGFRFQTEDDKQNFAFVTGGKGEWEKVKIPHYHGPVGRWTAFYRCEFRVYKKSSLHYRLHFLGTDYVAKVYLNGRFIGQHEGMFSPFDFSVTDVITNGRNVLVVEIENDLPTTGIEGGRIDGDKIYAATGIGWDDPADGWHHCPPGGGIFNKVFIEEVGCYHIDSVFMRPDIDNATAQAWVQIQNESDENYCERGADDGLSVGIKVFAYNFDSEAYGEVVFDKIPYTGPGINYYRYELSMDDFKLWEQDSPFLYLARVSLYDRDGKLLDAHDEVFGMRKFHMDEDGGGGDKGALYLNNKPVILRGANDMGHMQLAVCDEDWELLIKDILIAKACNMNFYRFTQRPVQDEIYHYCDMLGMLNQTDLPLFSTMRRNQFYEGVRQTGEMERLIRSHPSSIMVTYINEAVPIERDGKLHRHLGRDELEAFFECCDRAVRLENPDRVIKRVEGDYDPPTYYGLSDFHCYNMWYTNHALPVGRLYANWLPAIRTGWKTGCGEYGTEGLDSFEVMSTRYPNAWLPDKNGDWLPDRIVNAQSNTMHGDWYEEQEGIHNWIEKSQAHQAFAARLMTDALRRRSDKVISTAIHLLIDAWPAGWMKTLVGVDRVPKPAYFDFAHSLVPLRNNLRSDRWTAYGGEEIKIENWLLNDLSEDVSGLVTVITARDGDGNVLASRECCDDVAAASPKLSAVLEIKMPEVEKRGVVHFDSALYRDGNMIHGERFSVGVFPRKSFDKTVACIGTGAVLAAKSLGLDYFESDSLPAGGVAFVSNSAARLTVLPKGCKVILLPSDDGGEYTLAGGRIGYEYLFNNGGAAGMRTFDEEEGVAFVARNPDEKETREFSATDFSYFYNADRDFIDTAAANYMVYGGGYTPLLFSYEKPSFFERTSGHKRKRPVALRTDSGVYALSCSVYGRLGVNPVLDGFFYNIINA